MLGLGIGREVNIKEIWISVVKGIVELVGNVDKSAYISG